MGREKQENGLAEREGKAINGTTSVTPAAEEASPAVRSQPPPFAQVPTPRLQTPM